MLIDYANSIVWKAHKKFASGHIFAKVLTRNDDSGRHGVLIPTDAYSYFPELPIPNAAQNVTGEFSAFDWIKGSGETLAYKYYQRYPERRITRLNAILNDANDVQRILIFLHAVHTDGTSAYYFDCANSVSGGRFAKLFNLIFGGELQPVPGNFIIRPVDSGVFSADSALSELLDRFDEIKVRGWVDTLREGDTGVGYTFETMLGIKENNDQTADYKGIEIKCKGLKEGAYAKSGKINLFQSGPTWLLKCRAKDRLRILGKPGEDGLYSCYSQVTTTANNLGLMLQVVDSNSKIDLKKNSEAMGYWLSAKLGRRLAEKHSRAAFVKARTRQTKSKTQYAYEELVYCDQPSIQRFLDLVAQRNIVFEFTMSEKLNGTVRNHGYPWRLVRAQFLDQLFAFQIKLR